MFLDKTFSRHKILLGPKVFRPENLLDPKKFRIQIFFGPNFFLNLGILSNFCKISFLIRALLLWEKVTTEKENWGRKRRKRKKTDENSGHYIIAISRPPESRPPESHKLVPKKEFVKF